MTVAQYQLIQDCYSLAKTVFNFLQIWGFFWLYFQFHDRYIRKKFKHAHIIEMIALFIAFLAMWLPFGAA